MDGFENRNPEDGSEESSDALTDNTLFDASQYAFFGGNIVEEFELGGFEENIDGDMGEVEGDNEEFQFSSSTDREKGLQSFSDMDDITSTSLKNSKGLAEPINISIVGDRGSSFQESFLPAHLSSEINFPINMDQLVLDVENVQGDEQWCSSPQFSSARRVESELSCRTSSHPFQQGRQESISSVAVLAKNSSTSYPPLPSGKSQASQILSCHSSIPSIASNIKVPSSAPHSSHFSAAQLHLPDHQSFDALGLPTSKRQHKHQLDQANRISADYRSLSSFLCGRRLPHANGSTNASKLSQNHKKRRPASFSNLSSQALFTLYSSNSPIMNNLETVLGVAESRGQAYNLAHQVKLRSHYLYDSSCPMTGKLGGGFRSKYMTGEDIERVLHMQYSATDEKNSYMDDYYDLASLAKAAPEWGMDLSFHLRPTYDLPSHSRVNKETCVIPQIDVLRRVPFSSIRRPSPPLEVDSHSVFAEYDLEHKSYKRSLEKEPMFAARIIIEDVFCVLLEVDDIDRLLQFTQPPDGGCQLRRCRREILGKVASSLQLVDPIDHCRGGQSIEVDEKDDIVFMYLVSLPKGRRLLSRLLLLILPGSELIRIVCMTIFRHLRFLFHELPSDRCEVEATTNLARTVSSCVFSMNLTALSYCLAAIVFSREQPPPLRPLGSSAGDGASIIIKSILDRATELLNDPHGLKKDTINSMSFWQASFNAFFGLLTKYCLGKYDSVMQSILAQSPDTFIIGTEVTKAISGDMPVELLRAGLPHTDDNQRKVLLDFARRYAPVTRFSVHEGRCGSMDFQSVAG